MYAMMMFITIVYQLRPAQNTMQKLLCGEVYSAPRLGYALRKNLFIYCPEGVAECFVNANNYLLNRQAIQVADLCF